MTDAELLDRCSAILESHGARPVPKADPGWTFSFPGGGQRRCRRCRHPVDEHGVTGACFHPHASCRCGW